LGYGAATLYSIDGRKVATIDHSGLVDHAIQTGHIKLQDVAPGMYWMRRAGLAQGRAIEVK